MTPLQMNQQQLGVHYLGCYERMLAGYPCNCHVAARMPTTDVNHPVHYTSHPSKIECITIVEHMTFNTGNAVKYIWRAGLKSPDAIKDLQKAQWYIDREIGRLLNGEKDNPEEYRASDLPTADGAR